MGDRLQRRLAAVMALDVAGYSRLTEDDAEGTHRRLRALMSGVIEPRMADAGGRIVKRTGDGALMEFPSVSEAIRAAVRIQVEADAHERDQPADRQLRLRIGINLGDVIAEEDDIYGDGVNIAARLEALGRPGDVIASESAVQTADRADFAFVDLGVQRLKNISRPVRAYRVVLAEGASGAMPSPAGAVSRLPGFGERPAIAVLPFRFEGAAAEHEPFADGLTEDIIVGLSGSRSFPVIARNSVFAYKGAALDAVAVSQQLGARYVVEGGIRRGGEQVRTTVQLIDCATTETLLAERFDFVMRDVFAVQGDIVRAVLGAIEPELLKRERERAARVPAHSANAYESYQRGMWHHYRHTKADSEEAQAHFGRALAADPNYAQAAAAMSISQSNAVAARWVADRRATLASALAFARQAVQADPRDPMTHFAFGLSGHWNGLMDESIAHLQETIRLNPSHAGAHANLAFVYNYLNRPNEALPQAELALRLSPHDPRRFIWLQALAASHYLAGRYRAALATAQEALTIKPDYGISVRYLLASLGQLGYQQQAAAVLPLMRRLEGDLASTEALMRTTFVEAAVQHVAEGLRKAGFI